MCILFFAFSVFSFVAFPSVLWYCWLGLLTCKNHLPCNLYCVGGDVKHYSANQSAVLFAGLWSNLLTQVTLNILIMMMMTCTSLKSETHLKLCCSGVFRGLVLLAHFQLTLIFTARCYAERSIAMASCLSVCLSVRNVEVLWLHRLEIFKNNFMVS